MLFNHWQGLATVLTAGCLLMALTPVSAQDGEDRVDYFWKIARYIRRYCNNGIRRNNAVRAPELINIHAKPYVNSLSEQDKAIITNINQDFKQQCGLAVTSRDRLSTTEANTMTTAATSDPITDQPSDDLMQSNRSDIITITA